MNTLSVLDAYSQDIMPILTPTNNPKNSAYRVSHNTFYTIIKEFNRAKKIIKEIAPKSAKKYATESQEITIEEEVKQLDLNIDKRKWTKLFKKIRFFALYEHYIKIDILSTDEEAHQKWLGQVESQLRRLMQLLGDCE